MESNRWDPIAAAAVVVRAIEDIDRSNDEQRDDLLLDLVCAAWGSPLLQNQ